MGSGRPITRDDCDGFGYGEACELAARAGMEVVAGPFFNAEPSLACDCQPRGDRSATQHPRRSDARRCRSTSSSSACTARRWLTASTTARACSWPTRARIVGSDVAIGVLLDLHANVTSAMCSQRRPHRVVPRVSAHRLRASVPPRCCPCCAAIAGGDPADDRQRAGSRRRACSPRPEEPMRSFVRRITAAQQRPGVLMVSANHGFEGSDTPFMGASVVVTTDDDEALAERDRRRGRRRFPVDRRRPTRGAGSVSARPSTRRSVNPSARWSIADRSDNAGAGAASDSTYILAELIDRGVTDAALGIDLGSDGRARLPRRRCRCAACRCGSAARPVVSPVHRSMPTSRSPPFASMRCRRCSVRARPRTARTIGRRSHRRHRCRARRRDDNRCSARIASPSTASTRAVRHILVVKSMQHFMGGFAPIAAASFAATDRERNARHDADPLPAESVDRCSASTPSRRSRVQPLP